MDELVNYELAKGETIWTCAGFLNPWPHLPVAIIVTDHAAIDWDLVGREAGLIIDTRNAMEQVAEIRGTVLKA